MYLSSLPASGFSPDVMAALDSAAVLFAADLPADSVVYDRVLLGAANVAPSARFVAIFRTGGDARVWGFYPDADSAAMAVANRKAFR